MRETLPEKKIFLVFRINVRHSPAVAQDLDGSRDTFRFQCALRPGQGALCQKTQERGQEQFLEQGAMVLACAVDGTQN
jgi:hypothetical protein